MISLRSKLSVLYIDHYGIISAAMWTNCKPDLVVPKHFRNLGCLKTVRNCRDSGEQVMISKVVCLKASASELGGPSGKLFRFVSCVRARGAYVRSDLGENPWAASFPFPFSGGRFSLFPLPSKVLSSFKWLYR